MILDSFAVLEEDYALIEELLGFAALAGLSGVTKSSELCAAPPAFKRMNS